jgi:signal transduction histidine kinase
MKFSWNCSKRGERSSVATRARLGAWAVPLLLLYAATAVPAPPIRRVLLLHSLEHESAPFATFEQAFRRNLGAQLPEGVQFSEVSLQTGQGADQEPVLGYALARFGKQPPDLIVSMGGPAARFAQKYRQRLFPSTPLVFAAVDQRHLEGAVLTSSDTVVAVRHDPAEAIEAILNILPKTKNIFVVLGNSELERFWRSTLERDLERFRARLTFAWGNGLSFSEILKRSATLPPHSAIFYALMSVDSSGVVQTEEDALADLQAVANAPLFGVQSSQMGHGIVGGPLMSMEELGVNTARVAARILGGELPGSIKTQVQTPGPPSFDWRELRRWNIDENRLPPNSVVRFREPTFWERYKAYVVAGAAVCIAELLMIFALFTNLIKRRQAEEVARRLGRKLLQAEEAERARIARELHDDVTQRLARLAIDTSELHSERDSSTRDAMTREVRDELKRLSEDVHSLAYKMHPALLKRLGLARSLEAECDRFSRQESIDVKLKIEEIPDLIPHDTALCLVRVTQEALTNVVRHAQSKTADVCLRMAEDGFELTVTDSGVGFNGSMESSLRLGFASMQERVRLLNGKLVVDSRPARGTTVRAWVPFEKNSVK